MAFFYFQMAKLIIKSAILFKSESSSIQNKKEINNSINPFLLYSINFYNLHYAFRNSLIKRIRTFRLANAPITVQMTKSIF